MNDRYHCYNHCYYISCKYRFKKLIKCLLKHPSERFDDFCYTSLSNVHLPGEWLYGPQSGRKVSAKESRTLRTLRTFSLARIRLCNRKAHRSQFDWKLLFILIFLRRQGSVPLEVWSIRVWSTRGLVH